MIAKCDRRLHFSDMIPTISSKYFVRLGERICVFNIIGPLILFIVSVSTRVHLAIPGDIPVFFVILGCIYFAVIRFGKL